MRGQVTGINANRGAVILYRLVRAAMVCEIVAEREVASDIVWRHGNGMLKERPVVLPVTKLVARTNGAGDQNQSGGNGNDCLG